MVVPYFLIGRSSIVSKGLPNPANTSSGLRETTERIGYVSGGTHSCNFSRWWIQMWWRADIHIHRSPTTLNLLANFDSSGRSQEQSTWIWCCSTPVIYLLRHMFVEGLDILKFVTLRREMGAHFGHWGCEKMTWEYRRKSLWIGIIYRGTFALHIIFTLHSYTCQKWNADFF